MGLANERDLLLQAKQGNTAAYGQLVQAYQTAVFNVSYRLLGNRRDAEDMTQETFLRAYRALNTFDLARARSENLFAPWIKRIATNVCLNCLEARRIRPQTTASDLPRDEESDARDMDEWASGQTTPEQSLVQQERTQQLRAAILSLPPQYRAVIELRHQQEMSYADMAKALERPLSSVKSDLFRARKMLAEKMKA